jgi:hypothetical protein
MQYASNDYAGLLKEDGVRIRMSRRGNPRRQPQVIPTPSLSEALIQIPKRIDELLKILKGSRWFDVVAFDMAAVELALRTAAAIESGDKREGLSVTGAKSNFGRQIISLAIVANATQIISDDAEVAALMLGGDLPLPA